jgi:quercetin dioxygenase-like cupin family protein
MTMSVTTAPAAAEPLWFIHNLMYVRVDGEASRGQFALVETVGAQGDMPPLHVHRKDDETFYVLEGELSIFAGNQTPITLGPGDALVAPRDTPHTYRVESERARWLVACTPSGFDEFVREVADPAPEATLPPEDIQIDLARIGEAAARHGIELLAPPGTLP